MDSIEIIQRISAFTIKITSPIIILMIVTSSLWYASCYETKETFLCGPYNNDRLEMVSRQYLIISFCMCFFPCIVFLLSTCCIVILSQNTQDIQNP